MINRTSMWRVLRAALTATGVLSCAPNVTYAAVEWSTELGVAERRDDFTWNIADSDGTPNVLSELTWRDLKTRTALLGVEAEERRVVFLGQLGYGTINDGTVQDSDYNDNDRQDEYSRSLSKASGVNKEIEGSLGYRFGDAAWSVIPLAGYSVQAQNLRFTDGRAIIGTQDYTGLNSRYDARWKSWIAALEVRRTWLDGWQAALQARRLWSSYNGEADWNLIDDFAHPVSFRQSDRGGGVRFDARVTKTLSLRWAVAVHYSYQRLETEDGRDVAFYSDNTMEVTRLNNVEWTMRRVMLMMTGQFK